MMRHFSTYDCHAGVKKWSIMFLKVERDCTLKISRSCFVSVGGSADSFLFKGAVSGLTRTRCFSVSVSFLSGGASVKLFPDFVVQKIICSQYRLIISFVLLLGNAEGKNPHRSCWTLMWVDWQLRWDPHGSGVICTWGTFLSGSVFLSEVASWQKTCGGCSFLLCRGLVSTQQTAVRPVLAVFSACFSHTWQTWPSPPS